MLKICYHTAGCCLAAVVLAVFFSTGTSASDSSLTQLGQGFNELIYVQSRSVVTVEASKRVPINSLPLTGNEAVQRNVSTGLICDSLGHVLVAATAVINQDRINVRTDNRILPASLVGVDYHSGLALLSTNFRLGRPVTYSSQQICAGQMVLMLGNAFGVRASPSVGFCAGSRPDGTMQYTMPVTSGAIGSGIFDLSGDLLGIVVGSVDGDGRVAQAIPAHKLPAIVDILSRTGDRLAGFVGITTVEIEITPGINISSTNNLVRAGGAATREIDRGVVVTRVIPQSAADRAGLRPGDLVFGFRNQPVVSAPEFARQVIHTRPGEIVEMELLRHNTYMKVQLKIDQKELAASPTGSGRASTFPHDNIVADSLAGVIQDLKLQIRSLESQLSDLRR